MDCGVGSRGNKGLKAIGMPAFWYQGRVGHLPLTSPMPNSRTKLQFLHHFAFQIDLDVVWHGHGGVHVDIDPTKRDNPLGSYDFI